MAGRMSFIERMVHVTDVAWGRKPTGGYWVMWQQDGMPETADFATAHGAQSFAQWLDTTGRQPSVKEVHNAEKGFRELEEAVEEAPIPTPREQRRAIRGLMELEPLVRPVHVKRHGRRR